MEKDSGNFFENLDDALATAQKAIDENNQENAEETVDFSQARWNREWNEIVAKEALAEAQAFIDEAKTAAERPIVLRDGEKPLYVPNDDPETAQLFPWITAKVEDTAIYAVDNSIPVIDFTVEDAVSHKALLTAFADPGFGPQNLASIWDNNLRKLLEEWDDNDEDHALNIAENRSATNMAVTTLYANPDEGGKRYVPVHVLLNNQAKKALIVGDSIPSSLSDAFNKAGITYIDRNSPVALAKTEEALDELTKCEGEYAAEYQKAVKSAMKEAFMYRHSDPEKDSWPLPALLVDGAVEGNFYKFALKTRSARKMKWAP